MIMTMLCEDVDQHLEALHGNDASQVEYFPTKTVLYADDTLLVGTSPEKLQSHLDLVASIGASYSLHLHRGKTYVLKARLAGELHGPCQSPLVSVDHATYLGGLLSADARPVHELTRRLGEAQGSFQSSIRIWKHANVSKKRKIQIFESCVLSKLLYGLETVWLLKGDLARLNAFQARCLRQILRIPPSYVSRVPNSTVLAEAGVQTLSGKLLQKQLQLFCKVAQLPPHSFLRQMAFEPGTNFPRKWRGRRPVGRPRQTWTKCVHAHAVASAGSQRHLDILLQEGHAGDLISGQ